MLAAADAALVGPVRLLDGDLPPGGGAGVPGAGDRASAGGVAGAPASLEALRRAVARIEGRPEARLEPAPDRAARVGPGGGADGVGAAAIPSVRGRPAPASGRLALGVPSFDRLFPGGGPALAALTEVRTAQTRLAGAATGFLAALLVRIGEARGGPVLWVREAAALREAGATAGLGLAHLGLDPGRLLVVAVREAAEALWAAEEGLGCPGLSAVVMETHGLPRALDLTASRRLALRAREGGVPMVLAGHAMPEAASAAAVRLAVAPRRSRAVDGFEGGPGFPAWTVAVEKNRDGRTGRADMEWNSDARAFLELPPLPVARPAGDPHRPDGAAQMGQVLAHPAAVRRAS